MIVMDWMLISLPNSYVEILTTNEMVLGDGDLETWLGQ